MKKAFPLAALFMIFILLISACSSSNYSDSAGSASSTASYNTNYGMDTAAPQAAVTNDALVAESGEVALGGTNQVSTERKVVRHSYRTIETKEFDSVLDKIRQLVDESGGYIESSEVYGVSMTSDYGYNERSAHITARIPSDNLANVEENIDALGNVLSQSESVDDITDTYYDVEARLDSLYLQEERLLEILENADQLDEVLTLEQALSDVRYQIESAESSIARMDNQVSYSYLNIDLQEVVEYQVVSTPPTSFGERVAEAWGRSLQKVQSSLEGIVLFLVENLLSILLWAAIVCVFVFVIVKIITVLNRKSAKQSAAAAYNRPPVPPQNGQNRYPTMQNMPPQGTPPQNSPNPSNEAGNQGNPSNDKKDQ